ncbi:phosphoribosylglycinamide formyltransferase [Bernardetia sp.]|uniref:phosphoribosylglycinamide formyltransferase n=1 Tax=Bernardetia sp. TaxID=1937974 RepID=UPI0025B8449F|nr:phosphoribosylglycinamide formyltransferase [Bernardetia sp.]
MIRIAIFASGNGSNAAKIIEHFKLQKDVSFVVLSNNPNAFVIERAKRLGVEVAVFEKDELYKTGSVLNFLKCKEIDLIVLAGFMWLIPSNFVENFPDNIVNIHPALLPKYGGKGMYGDNVHKAVIKNKESQSGITIHLVNENYDEGQIIFQEKVNIDPKDNYETLAQKIHALEHLYYPLIIEELVGNLRKNQNLKEQISEEE